MSPRFTTEPTPLPGAFVVHRKPLHDDRGLFERVWCEDDLAGLLEGRRIRQVNRTRTRARGTVRGLHFQRQPHGEMKFIHCLRGQIFDVALDLRRGSATFGRWHAVELREDSAATFVIPEGFAHGFQTLSEDCELLYFHTSSHAPAADGGVNPADPELAIAWPLPIADMSPRDRALPFLDSAFEAL